MDSPMSDENNNSPLPHKGVVFVFSSKSGKIALLQQLPPEKEIPP